MNRDKNNMFLRNFIPVMVLVFVALGGLTGCGDDAPTEDTAAVMKNTAPVAKIQIQEDQPEAAAATEENTEIATAEESTATGGDDAGKATYNSICVACHGSGIPGIPQLGDAAAWAPRIAQGNDTLYEHAIAGFTGASGMPMPAKGGNPSLSDDAVKAAVDYLVTNSQ
jgi:cytochrome c5